MAFAYAGVAAAFGVVCRYDVREELCAPLLRAQSVRIVPLGVFGAATAVNDALDAVFYGVLTSWERDRVHAPYVWRRDHEGYEAWRYVVCESHRPMRFRSSQVLARLEAHVDAMGFSGLRAAIPGERRRSSLV
jgi:hypothetical protein